MKNEELDRLFRQKLEQLEGQPSLEAWQQLERQLQHKKERKTWFYLSSIAASLLLLLGIWGSLEYSSSFIPATPMAQKEIPDEKQNREEQPAVTTAARQQESQENKTIGGQETAEQNSQRANQEAAEHTANKVLQPGLARAVKTAKKQPPQAPAAVAETVELPEAEAKTTLINSLAEATSPTEPVLPMAVIEPVVISYKADKDEAGHTPAEPAQKEDKEFTPRKVLGFLKKVKDNSSGSLAELREAKDELLSLRFNRADFRNAD